MIDTIVGIARTVILNISMSLPEKEIATHHLAMNEKKKIRSKTTAKVRRQKTLPH